MNNRFLLIMLTTFCITAQAGEQGHRGYSGNQGPEHWGRNAVLRGKTIISTRP